MPTYSYTLVLSDAWSVVDINTTLASTLTIPPNSSVAFPVGTVVYVTKRTGNTLTFAAGSGVTVNSVNGNLTSTVAAGLVLVLIQVATDTWNIGVVPGGAATLNVGTTAGTVAAGDDSRFTDSRTPTGSAGGDLTGTYPNPTIGTGKVTSTHILDGTIVNADISASAAIALSKLSTTGTPSSSNFLRGDGAWSTATDSGALQKTSNLSDVSSAKTSRSNLSIPTPGRAAYSSATYYSIPGYTESSVSTLSLAANYMYHLPIFVTGDSIVIDRLAFEQTTAAAAGKSFRIGLYAGTTDWQPTGAALEDSGAIAADGANGVKTYTPSGGTRTLTPGIYILVICSDGSPLVRSWFGSLPGFPIGTSMGSTVPQQLARAFTFGSLPTASQWDTVNSGAAFAAFAAVRISNPSA